MFKIAKVKKESNNVKYVTAFLKWECSVLKKKIILWMKTVHYPNTIRSHLVTIVSMAPFTVNLLQG